MTEDVVAQRKVKFITGLPSGRQATFTHEKELWIAMPASKHKAWFALVDIQIGVLDKLRHHLIRWVSREYADADRVAFLLRLIAIADNAKQSAITDKTEVRTS